VEEVLKQLLCYFVDGTSRHLFHFDSLKEDVGYVGAIESDTCNLVSSHGIKRLFNSFSWPRYGYFENFYENFFSSGCVW